MGGCDVRKNWKGAHAHRNEVRQQRQKPPGKGRQVPSIGGRHCDCPSAKRRARCSNTSLESRRRTGASVKVLIAGLSSAMPVRFGSRATSRYQLPSVGKY